VCVCARARARVVGGWMVGVGACVGVCVRACLRARARVRTCVCVDGYLWVWMSPCRLVWKGFCVSGRECGVGAGVKWVLVGGWVRQAGRHAGRQASWHGLERGGGSQCVARPAQNPSDCCALNRSDLGVSKSLVGGLDSDSSSASWQRALHPRPSRVS
jgi:hypothetical protein